MHHFCTVEIAGETLRFRAIRPDGSIIEEFTIFNTDPAVID